MNHRLPVKGARAACILALVVLLGVMAGCSLNGGGTSSTTTLAGPTTTVSTSTTGADTTGTTSSLISEWDRKLREVAGVLNDVSNLLLEEKVPNADPRMGVVHGLRACTQAIACREALDQKNLELADTAMQELRYALNLARDVATDAVAQTVAGARAIVEPLGRPSAAPEEAAKLLDDFIAALAPLVDEAKALLPATTTTT